MKAIIAAASLVIPMVANAAPNQEFCSMVGSLAKGITEDKDRGVSYNAELGKIKGATEGLQSTAGIFKIAKGAIHTVYLDMPMLTPEGAYKLYYVACMSQK